jgi:hypothetical protein
MAVPELADAYRIGSRRTHAKSHSLPVEIRDVVTYSSFPGS